MTLEHEYALLDGFNRASVGRWLQVGAAAISAVIVFVLLSVVDLAKRYALDVNVPPVVMSLVGAGTVYGALYWLFSRHVWKLSAVARILKVPNLGGTWLCEGLTLEKEPNIAWSATVKIVQSWDKLRVHLETEQSISDSIAAALLHDEAMGYRLLYHYENRPRIGVTALAAHHGFAELTFATGENSATGEYFNGRGRNTWGKLKLTREVA